MNKKETASATARLFPKDKKEIRDMAYKVNVPVAIIIRTLLNSWKESKKK